MTSVVSRFGLVEADQETRDSIRLLSEVADLPAPSRYHYALSPVWGELDLRPSRSAACLRRFVDERVRRYPDLAGYRKQLLTFLRAVVNDGVRAKLSRLAVLAEAVGPGAVLAASFSFGVGAGVTLEGGAETNDPEAVRQYLAAVAAEGDDRQDPAPDLDVAFVTLSQQYAVRTAGIRTLRDRRTGHAAESYQVQYSIPVPGSTHLAVMTFSTQCGWAADELTVLFDVTAQTFYWTWERGGGVSGVSRWCRECR
ncbi:MAG: hypothetical protein ACJ73S_30615 [Mycobacteriales bacterium]